MKRKSLALCITACVVLTAGCAATKPDRRFADHAIRITGDGDITEVVGDRGGGLAAGGPAQFSSGPTKDYGNPIERLFRKAGDSGKNLLIFVHGGLNTFDDSTARTNRLIDLYYTPKRDQPLDNYYPLLINWDSGLWGSYGEHLTSVRQGEKWHIVGPLTSPFYFLADVGHAVVRSAIDVGFTGYRDLEAIPWFKDSTNTAWRNSELLYRTLRSEMPDHVSRGGPLPWGPQTFYKVPWNVVTAPFQLAVAPVVDGFGTPAWENMQRRTKNLYNRPEEFDIQRDPGAVTTALSGRPEAVMSEFTTQLEAFARKHPDVTITLVAHSMGAFIVNELVRRTPCVDYRYIVYMAGADSIRNTRDSVFPYLKMHPGTQFFNLTLHPQNEIEETEYRGLAPRGSLLVWIDEFLSTPQTHLDRTVGRWENIVQAYGEIDETIRKQIYIKAFDQTAAVRKHGDFSRACFWREEFWMPGLNDSDPWDKNGFYQADGSAAYKGDRYRCTSSHGSPAVQSQKAHGRPTG